MVKRQPERWWFGAGWRQLSPALFVCFLVLGCWLGCQLGCLIIRE
nr:MAG TPA: hypothetical protein [Caudoviricetes sp.]